MTLDETYHNGIHVDTALVPKCNVIHSVTLLPRLHYSLGVLDDIIKIIMERRNTTTRSNQQLVDCGSDDPTELEEAVESERVLVFLLDTLDMVRQRISGISRVDDIPKTLSPTIQAIRAASAQLVVAMPRCSSRLSEISVYLGSVIIDAALLAGVKFDFGNSNKEASVLLDEIKLITDSKLNEQYPNLVMT